jgi:DNA-binding PadR family transcriptional regulator
MLQSALLGVLDARTMSGYELVQFFNAGSGWLWSAPQSQIYPLLRKLEAGGLIVGEQRQRGKLERTVYSITEAGRAELHGWIATAQPAPPPRDAFALQMSLLDLVDLEAGRKVLTAFADEQQEIAESCEQHRDRLLAKDTPLLRERLRKIPEERHGHVARLKAHVFDGQARVARERARWAREAVSVLEEGASL